MKGRHTNIAREIEAKRAEIRKLTGEISQLSGILEAWEDEGFYQEHALKLRQGMVIRLDDESDLYKIARKRVTESRFHRSVTLYLEPLDRRRKKLAIQVRAGTHYLVEK